MFYHTSKSIDFAVVKFKTGKIIEINLFDMTVSN